MPSSLIELRPNRRLLDHNFEGYKLNLTSLPHWSHELSVPVDRVYPHEVQYSFLHAKLFALHNHLIPDRWDYRYNFYYIDEKQQIRRVIFNNENNTFTNTVVYDIPAHVERASGHFNLCLAFPAETLAVISDGTGYLHIASTSCRHVENKNWTTMHSEYALDGKYFVLLDARIEEKDEKSSLHCLIQSVEQKNEHFYSVLTWITFAQENKEWKRICTRQLEGKGIVHYAAIETSFAAVYIASDNPFKYISDSEKEIVEPLPVEPKNIVYTWLQTSEDVTVTLKLPTDFDKNLLHINVTPFCLKICYGGNLFIDGNFKNKIDSELTTWNVQDDGRLDVLVTKSESCLWDELIEGGDPKGEQIVDASLVEEAHRRLAHLCSETQVADDGQVTGLNAQELEECDVVTEEDCVLTRHEVFNHEITHRVPLSVHQYIFSIQLENKEVPALALRHDVDCCVWQPYQQLENTTNWPLHHQGTLNAFGYIQSSKQNRKFVTCPPDFSYSVVCESTRHLFVYRSVQSDSCQLRQRGNGGARQVRVGQQYVFNVDQYGEVLGVNAMNSYLFVLTQKQLVAIEVMS